MPKLNSSQIIFPLFLLIVIDAMGAGLILTILPDLFSPGKLGFLSVTSSKIMQCSLYGLSLSLFPLFVIFSAPLLGKMSDQHGRRKLLVFCSFMNVICYFILAFSVKYHILILFLFGRCLAGCVAGNQPIAQAALIDASKNDLNAKFNNLSLVSIAGAIGVIVGPILGGLSSAHLLIEKYGYSIPFLIGAIMSLLNVLLLCFFYQEKSSLQSKQNTKRIFLNPIKPLLWAISHEKTKYLVIILFCGQLCWGLYFQSLVLRLSLQYHFQTFQLGYFLAYIGACVTFGGVFVSKALVKRFEINSLVMGTLAMLMLSALFSGLMIQEKIQWVSVFFGAISAVIFNSAMLHSFTESVDDGATGLILGITTAVIYFSSIMSGLLSGFSNYVSYSFAPLISSAIALIGFILAFFTLNKLSIQSQITSEENVNC